MAVRASVQDSAEPRKAAVVVSTAIGAAAAIFLGFSDASLAARALETLVGSARQRRPTSS